MFVRESFVWKKLVVYLTKHIKSVSFALNHGTVTLFTVAREHILESLPSFRPEFAFALASGWFCFAQTRTKLTFVFFVTGSTRL